MMFKKRYVERYEIEFKLCGLWAYAGTVYPRYKWKIARPWYFLGLVKVPVLVDLVPLNVSLNVSLLEYHFRITFTFLIQPWGIVNRRPTWVGERD